MSWSLARAAACSICRDRTRRRWRRRANLPADAIILDLEDSVAPDAKPAARERIVAALKAGGFGGREMLIRVNGVHTPWGEADLEAAAAAAPDGVLLPKVDGPGTVMHAARILRAAPEKTRLWAMMETPNAMLNAALIAAIAADPASRLEALVLGLNDLAKETRARLTPGRRGVRALARHLRRRRARARLRRDRRRLQRHQGPRRLPRRNASRGWTSASTARR